MTALREQTQPSYFRAGINPAGSGSDIPAHRFVKQGTNKDEIALATAVTDKIKGVTTEIVYEGKSQSYKVSGLSKIQVGAAVAVGDYLTTDASGRAITAATAGDLIKGRAESAGGAADEIIEAEIFEGIAFL